MLVPKRVAVKHTSRAMGVVWWWVVGGWIAASVSTIGVAEGHQKAELLALPAPEEGELLPDGCGCCP
jgi:hypothetical protein